MIQIRPVLLCKSFGVSNVDEYNYDQSALKELHFWSDGMDTLVTYFIVRSYKKKWNSSYLKILNSRHMLFNYNDMYIIMKSYFLIFIQDRAFKLSWANMFCLFCFVWNKSECDRSTCLELLYSSLLFLLLHFKKIIYPSTSSTW